MKNRPIRWGSNSHPPQKKEYEKTNKNQFSSYDENTKTKKNGDEKKNIKQQKKKKSTPNHNERKLLKKINKEQIKQTEHHEKRLHSLF